MVHRSSAFSGSWGQASCMILQNKHKPAETSPQIARHSLHTERHGSACVSVQVSDAMRRQQWQALQCSGEASQSPEEGTSHISNPGQARG